MLTDIQGPEDHHGDMDLKVAGTEDGVTGMQMDVKVDGLTIEIFEKAFEQTRKARLEIFKVLTATLPAPRKEIVAFRADHPPAEDPTGEDRCCYRPGRQDHQWPH